MPILPWDMEVKRFCFAGLKFWKEGKHFHTKCSMSLTEGKLRNKRGRQKDHNFTPHLAYNLIHKRIYEINLNTFQIEAKGGILLPLLDTLKSATYPVLPLWKPGTLWRVDRVYGDGVSEERSRSVSRREWSLVSKSNDPLDRTVSSNLERGAAGPAQLPPVNHQSSAHFSSKELRVASKKEHAKSRVSSYFPIPNSRLMPGFSGSLFPKIPKILLANSNLNYASFIIGPSPPRNTIYKICFVSCLFLEKKGHNGLNKFSFSK